MTSSTKPSDGPSPRLTLAAFGVVVLLAGFWHGVLDPIAGWAETNHSAYLWREDDWMKVLTPVRYEGRGEGRLMAYGSSEAREAFLPAAFDEAMPDLRTYQHGQAAATIADGVVLMEYIERMYGEDAMPDVLVLGITPRFSANVLLEKSPLALAITKYSPRFRVEIEGKTATLHEKAAWEGLIARFRFRLMQQNRYRGGLLVLGRAVLHRLGSDLADHPRLTDLLSHAKYHQKRRWSDVEIRNWLERKNHWWEETHNWDAREEADRVRRDFTAFREICEKHDIELYAVVMPELEMNREMFDDAKYAAYLDIVEEALGDTPMLNLRTLLQDEHFYDACHPNLAGSKVLSKAVAEWVAEERAR